MSKLALLIAAAFFMENLDGSIIATALPAIGVSFATSAVDLHVGISAYLLTVAVFILPGGWAAERFGGRRVFTGAMALFLAGSALCGLSANVDQFVASRVLQGVGGAMMVPVGRLVVLREAPKHQLMRSIAILTWPGLTAPLLGPPLGGFIAQHAAWPWIFFINLPIGLVGLVLAWLWVPEGERQRGRRFDLMGFASGAVWLFCLMLALDRLGGRGADAVQVLALLAMSAAAGFVFVRHVRRAELPLVNVSVFRVDNFRRIMLGGTAMRIMISTMPFLLPLMFQLGFGLDATHAGLLLLTLFAGNLGIKPATSGLLRRFGFRPILLANGALQAGCMLVCALFTPETPYWAMVPVLVLAGASRSLQYTATTTLAYADVSQAEMGSANTLFSVSQQLAVGLGVAVAAVALQGAARVMGHDAPGLAAFHLSFVLMALLMAASTLDALLLARGAGDAVTRRASAS